MEFDDTREATISDYIEQGKNNGRESAGYLLQHCFGSPGVEQMPVENWWSVHLAKIEPEILSKLTKGGANEEQLSAFLDAWRTELNWCCMTYASLGMMGIPPEIFGIDSKTNVHEFEEELLNSGSSLEECQLAGTRCGLADARTSSLVGLYRGYDYATDALNRVIKGRVKNLAIAGLSENQRQHFIEAAQTAGPNFLAEVTRRWSEIQD